MLLGEFVVVSHLTIFPLELLGSDVKPMAGPSSSNRKIMRWDTFQISGGKHNCLLLPVINTNTELVLHIVTFFSTTRLSGSAYCFCALVSNTSDCHIFGLFFTQKVLGKNVQELYCCRIQSDDVFQPLWYSLSYICMQLKDIFPDKYLKIILFNIISKLTQHNFSFACYTFHEILLAILWRALFTTTTCVSGREGGKGW